MFDWSTLSTPYGSADGVPRAIEEAAARLDPIESLDAMLGQKHLVCDAGFVNVGAPPFVELLLEAALAARDAGRPAWPVLRTASEVMSARASLGDTFGLAPEEGPPFFGDPRSLDRRLIDSRQQTLWHREIDRVVRGASPLLALLIETGSSEERAVATVLAILSGAAPAGVVQALERALEREQNPRTRCALMLGWARLEPNAPTLRRHIAAGLAAGGVLSAGAATARLWGDADGVSKEELTAALRQGFAHQPSAPLELTFDYGWHRELIGGEAARAVWASNWADDEKLAVLEAGMSVPPRAPVSEYAAPELTAAPSAAWFYMRTGLRRHHHRASILGPEDLTEVERSAVQTLWDHRQSWLSGGVYLAERFGIVDFLAVAPRLTSAPTDSLSPLRTGVWAGREMLWSGWKWLRSSVDETRYGSEAREAAMDIAAEVVARGLSAEQRLELVSSVSAAVEVPLDAVLIELLSSAVEAGGLVVASKWATVDERARRQSARPGTTTDRDHAVHLASVAAFGTEAEYRSAVQSTLGLSQRLFVAIEETARLRGFTSAQD